VREHRSPTGTTVGVRTDITAMKRAEEKMRRFAEEDPLTGLFNRSRFFLALDDIRANASSQQFGCVVLFDIDHFKPINDAYGHNVGDEVLTAIAERMRSILGPNDVGARLGGDEFVFALIDKGDQGACDAILQHLSDLMDHPIETSSGPLKLSLSIGAAPFVDGSINSHDLLKHADLAQYLAKERGRAQWCWFTDEDRRELDHNAKLGRMLSESLNTNKGMDCSFTPIAEACNGGALGFSAELSWSHDGEVISAQSLRQLAQKSSQSARLSIQELSQAFEVAGAQEARGIDVGDIWVAVNADRLKIAHFADRLHELGETYGIPPKQITVAVEEKAFSERSASAVETTLKAIKSSGIQIAIDQFGSAASSLVKLVSLGIDKVRLSSDVTDPLADPTADDTVVRGLVGIAKTFQIEVYAVNPQTPAHAARLADLGCDGLQGGIVGASLSSEAVPDYLGAVALRTLEGISNDMRALSANSSNKASEDAA
jgi:diguanylate cyclase (GGDEF)-like protein